MGKYSIHRCLAELKLLDSKITKATSAQFVGLRKNSSDGEYSSQLDDEKFATFVKSNYDSVVDLIKRRKEIKEAVVNSNAVTKVTIGGQEYTVASAIERKSSISYEKDLLSRLNHQYKNSIGNVTSKNDSMEMKLDMQVSQMLGGDKSSKSNENISNFAEMYRKQNGWTMCDPLNVASIIEKMEKEINEFETEVDYVLSTSNAITEVEISE